MKNVGKKRIHILSGLAAAIAFGTLAAVPAQPAQAASTTCGGIGAWVDAGYTGRALLFCPSRGVSNYAIYNMTDYGMNDVISSLYNYGSSNGTATQDINMKGWWLNIPGYQGYSDLQWVSVQSKPTNDQISCIWPI